MSITSHSEVLGGHEFGGALFIPLHVVTAEPKLPAASEAEGWVSLRGKVCGQSSLFEGPFEGDRILTCEAVTSHCRAGGHWRSARQVQARPQCKRLSALLIRGEKFMFGSRAVSGMGSKSWKERRCILRLLYQEPTWTPRETDVSVCVGCSNKNPLRQTTDTYFSQL